MTFSENSVEPIMEQAQVFASAWSLVGGKFDNGDGMAHAEAMKSELRMMLLAALVEAQQPAPSAAAAPSVSDGQRALHEAILNRLSHAELLEKAHYLMELNSNQARTIGELQDLVESTPQPSPTPHADSQPAPAVDEDGERYRHLIETLDDQPHGKPTLGAAWDDDIGFWTKGSFFGLKDKASIDAAIDAERAQGNTL